MTKLPLRPRLCHQGRRKLRTDAAKEPVGATIAGPHRGSVFSARAGGFVFMSGGTISAVEKLEHDRSFPSR